MNTLIIILIVSVIVLWIANFVISAIERKKKPTTPIYKARAILDDDLTDFLDKVTTFIGSANIISAEYQKIGDTYIMTLLYTED